MKRFSSLKLRIRSHSPPAMKTLRVFRYGAIASNISTRFQNAWPIKHMSLRYFSSTVIGLNRLWSTASGM